MEVIYTDKPIEQAALTVATSLRWHLSRGDRVLWLLSGGSGSKIALAVSDQLRQLDLTNLYVSMTDERYGPVGHPDENWQQLLDAGLSLPGATLYRPLIGTDCATTTSAFSDWLEAQYAVADYKLGIFGVGPDGHTAGIKPQSSAVDSTEYAASYEGSDFERITMTFRAISDLSEAIIQASGEDKRPTVTQLLKEEVPLATQPSQILKTVPQTKLFTDIQEEL